MNDIKKKVPVSFLALDPHIETFIPSPVEKELRGKDMVEWGDRNKYPEFLWELYNSVASLRSIVNGTRDFIVGDAQQIQIGNFAPGVVNSHGDTARMVNSAISVDKLVYGGFALQVIRNIQGDVVETYHCPLRFLRMNKDCQVFYYSEKWAVGGITKTTVYPAFMPISKDRWNQLSLEERNRNLSSILLVKDSLTTTYPIPLWSAAVNDCETERQTSVFHLNAINNGFVSSMVINFNNGVPDDETKDEIERAINEKFSGAANAGRIFIAFNSDHENAVTITEPKVENFGDRYIALSKHVRQQIFTAFRASPVLFGIPTDNNGFSVDDYTNAFKLYNRTMVRPIQREICDAYDRIFGRAGVLTITPFSLDESAETKVN